jgi:hypothetical protein
MREGRCAGTGCARVQPFCLTDHASRIINGKVWFL